MAQFTVRNIDDDIKSRLKLRAARHGLSMEEEVRQILRSAVHGDVEPPMKLGSRIAGRFARIGLVDDIPERHGQAAVPGFDEPA